MSRIFFGRFLCFSISIYGIFKLKDGEKKLVFYSAVVIASVYFLDYRSRLWHSVQQEIGNNSILTLEKFCRLNRREKTLFRLPPEKCRKQNAKSETQIIFAMPNEILMNSTLFMSCVNSSRVQHIKASCETIGPLINIKTIRVVADFSLLHFFLAARHISLLKSYGREIYVC